MDWIDQFADAWAREYPAKDTSGLLLITQLARLSILIDTFQREILEPMNLTPGDYSVLAALRRAGPPYELAPSRLYSDLERSSGGMTKMLKRLEALGLVKRSPDREDKRSTLVALTPTGMKLEEQAFNTFLSSTHDLLEPIARSKLERIDNALRSLLDAVENHFYR
jgi:DNA-binding MarR family transcriptional regulator